MLCYVHDKYALSCFAEVHMTCLLCVLCSTLLSLASPATNVAFNGETVGISEVVSLLQDLA